MSKEQMMQEFVSSAITPLLEMVVIKKLVQSFDVIAEKQKSDLASANARIADLERQLSESRERENVAGAKALRAFAYKLAQAASTTTSSENEQFYIDCAEEAHAEASRLESQKEGE